jgi:hypothetical protein
VKAVLAAIQPFLDILFCGVTARQQARDAATGGIQFET